MDPFLIGVIGIGALLILIAMGVHIGIALLLVGLVGCTSILGFTPALWAVVGSSFSRTINSAFLPLPLFIFMGLLAAVGGIGRNIFDSLSLWVRRIKGGVGVATVLCCAAFGTVSGSSLVTASVFARVSAPEMRRLGYNKLVAYGICSSAGMIGMLIPPSVLAVVYAMVSELSVGRLLIAGTMPGLLITVLYSIAIITMAYMRPALFGGSSASVGATWRERIVSLKNLWTIILIIVIVFGGILGGVFSPDEAASVALVAMFIIFLSISGPGRWSELGKVTLETVSTTAMIFLILTGSIAFSNLMVVSGVSYKLVSSIVSLNLSEIQFVIAMVVVYLILGCFLDSVSMVVITIPLIMPVVHMTTFDPIWFATITIVAIEIGVITPPVGLNVYAVKAVAESDVSLEELFRGVMPFFLIDLVALVILIAFPVIITILPSLMK